VSGNPRGGRTKKAFDYKEQNAKLKRTIQSFLRQVITIQSLKNMWPHLRHEEKIALILQLMPYVVAKPAPVVEKEPIEENALKKKPYWASEMKPVVLNDEQMKDISIQFSKMLDDHDEKILKEYEQDQTSSERALIGPSTK
jgi:hypothetical protein